MQLVDAAELYCATLMQFLTANGFKRQNKTQTVRKNGACLQGICAWFVKSRGYPSGQIRFNVFYTFSDINKIAAFIQGIPYRKNFATGVFRSANGAPGDVDYSHTISESTDGCELKHMARIDHDTITRYFLPLLDLCETPQKLFFGLSDNASLQRSLAGLGLVEWSQIAILLYLGETEKALAMYDQWTPIAFYGKRPLTSEQVALCRDRIASWKPGTVPNGL